MAIKILIFFSLFSLLCISPSAPTDTDSLLYNAVNALSDSGYYSMGMAVEFGLKSFITSFPSSLTIFSPSDAIFTNSGQPSLDILQCHFSPLSFPPQSLKLLPRGYKIPTLCSNHSLTVTSDLGDDKFEVNGVQINEFSVYSNGSLIIYGIDEFLDPNFEVLASPSLQPLPEFDCSFSVGNGDSINYSFKDAIEALRLLEGYEVIASFLDLQLVEFDDQKKVTLFAPSDDSLYRTLGNINEYRSIFLRHFVGCRLLWTDLATLEVNGIQLATYLDGLMVNVSTDLESVRLNGSAIVFPELYKSDWLVIHGLDGNFAEKETDQETPDASSKSVPEFNCSFSIGNGDSINYSFKDAIEALRLLEGYEVIASFLDLQLAESNDQKKVTLFAPSDDSLYHTVGNINEYRSIFLRHFVGCRLLWTDLATLEANGIQLATYLDGLMVNVSTDLESVRLNGSAILFPELYRSDWLVIHGLDGNFAEKGTDQETPDASSKCATRNCRLWRSFFILLYFFFGLCLLRTISGRSAICN